MIKQFTVSKLRELVNKYPGDKAEVKKFMEWLISYDPNSELFKGKNTATNQFAKQWVDICLMQIEHKRREVEKKLTE